MVKVGGNIVSRYIEEVQAEPDILRMLYEYYQGEFNPVLKRAAADLAQYPVITLTGMGSSLYASLAAKYHLQGAGRLVMWEEAGELLHYHSGAALAQTGLVAVSQSGESVETANLLAKVTAARNGSERVVAVAVTNNLESSMARMAAHALPLLAGEERGTSSKTFAASLLALILLAEVITGESTDSADFGLCFNSIERGMAGWQAEAAAVAESLQQVKFISLIGRGPTLAVVYQTSLILSEMARVQASPYPGGTFRHGPIELAGQDHAAIIVAPEGETQSLLVKLAEELAGYGSRVWLLTSAGKAVETVRGLQVTHLPVVSERLAVLPYAMPLQFFAAEYARLRGYEPGKLFRCPKVITEE